MTTPWTVPVLIYLLLQLALTSTGRRRVDFGERMRGGITATIDWANAPVDSFD